MRQYLQREGEVESECAGQSQPGSAAFYYFVRLFSGLCGESFLCNKNQSSCLYEIYSKHFWYLAILHFQLNKMIY